MPNQIVQLQKKNESTKCPDSVANKELFVRVYRTIKLRNLAIMLCRSQCVVEWLPLGNTTEPNAYNFHLAERSHHSAFSRCTFAWDPFAVLLIISANNQRQAVAVARSYLWLWLSPSGQNSFRHDSFRQLLEIHSPSLSTLSNVSVHRHYHHAQPQGKHCPKIMNPPQLTTTNGGTFTSSSARLSSQ